MSTFQEHQEDTIQKLGKPFDEVHTYMDQHQARVGPRHRHILHHKEGVEEVRQKFGDEAAKAAECHILLDCYGKIPTQADYQTGRVDWFGIGDDNGFSVINGILIRAKRERDND